MLKEKIGPKLCKRDLNLLLDFVMTLILKREISILRNQWSSPRFKLFCFKCSYTRSHNRKKGIDAIKLDYQKNSLYFTLFNVTHKENPAQISVFNFSSVKKEIYCVWQNETVDIARAH